MLHSAYDDQVCSIARTLEVVGERWTFLILRDLFLGLRRFDELQDELGIARNVLAARLDKLVAEGVVEKRPYSERPLRHEYRLTPKGRDLWPTMLALLHWGDEHVPTPGGPPTVVVHRGACGGAVDAHGRCATCGDALDSRGVRALPGPGASPDHPLVRAAGRAGS